MQPNKLGKIGFTATGVLGAGTVSRTLPRHTYGTCRLNQLVAVHALLYVPPGTDSSVLFFSSPPSTSMKGELQDL